MEHTVWQILRLTLKNKTYDQRTNEIYYRQSEHWRKKVKCYLKKRQTNIGLREVSLVKKFF